MEVIRSADLHIDRPTAVCIGKFDGVHVGHQKLLRLIAAQKSKGLLATVFTFDPTPEELFTGRHDDRLTSNEEKESYLEELGVDIVIEYPLTYERAAMEPEDFVRQVLVDGMNMKYLAAGADLSFGREGRGDRALMERLGQELGFTVEIIDKVCVDGETVSSTRVRRAIEDGRLEETFRLLGRKKV